MHRKDSVRAVLHLSKHCINQTHLFFLVLRVFINCKRYCENVEGFRRSRSRRTLPEWVKETYSGASLHYRRLSLRSAQSLRCSLTLRASTISPIEKPQLQRTSARGEHCGETHKGTTTLSAIREACLGSLSPHKLWENSGYAQLIVSSESGWQNAQVSVLQEHRSSGKRCTEGRCRCQSAYPRCRGDCRILGGPPRGQSVQRGTKLKPRQDDSVFLRCGFKNLHFASYLRKTSLHNVIYDLKQWKKCNLIVVTCSMTRV